MAIDLSPEEPTIDFDTGMETARGYTRAKYILLRQGLRVTNRRIQGSLNGMIAI
jgi:hypothetical protein